tara:strand:- start:910 stop:1239 length:330 start_codon:yes stop_codon:yes gene_type:complete
MAIDRFKKRYNNINYNMLNQISKNANYYNQNQLSYLRQSEIEKILKLCKYVKRFTKTEKEFFNTKINDAEYNYQDIQTFTLHITNRCRLKRNDFTILFKMFKKYNISFD